MASTAIPTIAFSSTSLSNSNPSIFLRCRSHFHLKQFSKRPKFSALCAAQVSPAEGYPMDEFFTNDNANTKGTGDEKWNAAQYEALLKGGDQVASVLEEMAKLLEDMNMDEASEEVAVQLAAQGVIGKRVDEMESGFMMALDYMIQLAEKDEDDKAMIETFLLFLYFWISLSISHFIGDYETCFSYLFMRLLSIHVSCAIFLVSSDMTDALMLPMLQKHVACRPSVLTFPLSMYTYALISR